MTENQLEQETLGWLAILSESSLHFICLALRSTYSYSRS